MWWERYLSEFVTLFLVINPFGVLPAFLVGLLNVVGLAVITFTMFVPAGDRIAGFLPGLATLHHLPVLAQAAADDIREHGASTQLGVCLRGRDDLSDERRLARLRHRGRRLDGAAARRLQRSQPSVGPHRPTRHPGAES